MDELLKAFVALGTGEDLEKYRATLLDHLKATIPKAERKAMRDQALVETIERMEELGLELFSRPHGAIDVAARRFKVGYSSAAKVWKAHKEYQDGEVWNLFLNNRNF